MTLKHLFLSLVSVIFINADVLAKTKISIQKAFDKKYITAKAICKGGLELDYSVSNLLKDSLMVFIPAGWRFNSNAGKADYQDILLVREQILVLKPKETKQFDITGYCCEATKLGPVKGVPYTTGKLADSSLVSLARYLSIRKVDANMEQYSVWAISDHQETAHIASNNDSIAALLRAFVATVKREHLPWYTLLKRAKVTNLGAVHDHPIKFKADIKYNVAETCYSYCYIVDASGNTVSEIFGKWLLGENNEYAASFNVAQLKKGDYKLVLQGNKLPIFEKAFKI